MNPRACWSIPGCLPILLLGVGTLAAQTKLDDMSPDPEVQRQLMQAAPGFEVQLVASEPTIVNPIQINFDPQGRLWVLCAPRYPQLLPGQEANDYVVVLEDFDAAGKARKSRVVADKLMVPTGMMPGDGGVYIGQGETLLHFRSSKGTGKADERRVVFTGFGTADTHHTLNTFRWGPDGSLYFNQGVYIQSTVETPHGPRRLFGGCVWQLRTDRLQLEVYDRSILPNNTWGHAFDAWGQSFLASAWPGALNLVLPDTPLHRNTTPELVPPLKMTQIGGDRHCGLEIVNGRHLPEDWQHNLLTGDFLSHRVYRYALTDDGQRFMAKPLPPLVVSKHRRFRPVDIKQGPDGAIYIADLHQQIIQHNQIDFRDPRRDHTRGRIWRIVRQDRPLLAPPPLVNVTVAQVLDQLKAPELWTRTQAKRALAERDRKAVGAALAQWAAKLDAQDPDYQRHLLEALWTYQTIDQVEPALLSRLLRASEPRVRAAATRVAGYWHDRLPNTLPLLAAQARDPQPRVRLEAVLAATRIPSAEAARIALLATDEPLDPLLEFAVRKAAVVLQPFWYPEFRAGRFTFAGNTKHLALALQAIRASDAVPTLVALLQEGKVPANNQGGVLRIVAALGTEQHQALAWQTVVKAQGWPPTDRASVLEALAQAARQRKSVPGHEPQQLASLFDQADAALAAAALRLAGSWKQEELRGAILRHAQAASDPVRAQAAVAALVELGGARSTQALAALADQKRPFNVRLHALTGLVALDVKQAAERAGMMLREPLPPGFEVSPLITAFVQHKGGTQALAKVLGQSKPSADAAKVGLRVLVGLGVPAEELATVLRAAAGQAGQQRQLEAGDLKRLLELVRTQGDAARGEAVFRRATLGCFQCHALGGAGGKVGPDLSGIGTSAPLEYLLESVVLPSKIVREGFTTVHVFTRTGKAISGVLQRESGKELVLRDPLREEIVIPVADIEEKKTGGSLMPNGLDQSLTDAELADLVRFLAELGKPGAFAVTHVPLVRRWQYLASLPNGLLALDDISLGKVLREDGSLGWQPVYSTVAGQLPLAEVAQSGRALLRCQVEVVTPGKLALALNQTQGLKLWVNGSPTPVQAKTMLTLPRGLHLLDFAITPGANGPAYFRCELAESGTTAQARFVQGQ